MNMHEYKLNVLLYPHGKARGCSHLHNTYNIVLTPLTEEIYIKGLTKGQVEIFDLARPNMEVNNNNYYY